MGEGGGTGVRERTDILRELRNNYLSVLGAAFHHKNAKELAELSLNLEYTSFVEDYVHGVCSAEFRQKYESVKESQLETEASAQRQPSCINTGLEVREVTDEMSLFNALREARRRPLPEPK